MKKYVTFVAISVAALISGASCANIGMPVARGTAFGLITIAKQGISGTKPGGSKTGTACAHSVLNVVSFGDASINEAANNGQITTINSVDRDNFFVLVYGRTCTIVRGDG